MCTYHLFDLSNHSIVTSLDRGLGCRAARRPGFDSQGRTIESHKITALRQTTRPSRVSDEHYVTKILPPTGTLRRGPWFILPTLAFNLNRNVLWPLFKLSALKSTKKKTSYEAATYWLFLNLRQSLGVWTYLGKHFVARLVMNLEYKERYKIRCIVHSDELPLVGSRCITTRATKCLPKFVHG